MTTPENGFRHGRDPRIVPEIHEKVDYLVQTAKTDAISRTDRSIDAKRRVETAIEHRLRPHLLENEVIGQQINDPRYSQELITPTVNYLEGIRIAGVLCPDGRIIFLVVGDPRVASFSRRLQGMQQTRQSTRDRSQLILHDPEITASLATDIKRRQKNGDQIPEVVEFSGPHINSRTPVEGCGKRKGIILDSGSTPEIEMQQGGISSFFEDLGDGGFDSFDNTIAMLGGKGATFDLIHDTYSQGLFFGVRKRYQDFDKHLSLWENLQNLTHDRKIISTELMDNGYRQQIHDLARASGRDIQSNPLKVDDYIHFADNAILIAKIARQLTMQEEERRFDIVPESLSDGKSDGALRALTYTAIRNVVYRVTGNIRPGQHNLMHHPEELIRIGPIGADFNVSSIPFIQYAPPGTLSPTDQDALKDLYGLSYGIAKERGVQLQNEGRIILTTGAFDRAAYVDDEAADSKFEAEQSFVGNNAAAIRDIFPRSVETGETIVLGMIHEPRTRQAIAIAK